MLAFVDYYQLFWFEGISNLLMRKNDFRVFAYLEYWNLKYQNIYIFDDSKKLQLIENKNYSKHKALKS